MAKKKASKLTAADESLLSQAIVALNTGNPLFATQAAMKTLMEYFDGKDTVPLVEWNAAMTDPADGTKIAFRASPAGAEMNKPDPAQQPQQQPGAQPSQQQQPQTGATAVTGTETEVASDFVLEEGIAIPALKRGGRGGSAKKNPFESMGLQASFFIPKTADNLKPSKRIASVVSNASKSLAPKKFKVQAVAEIAKATPENPKGEGARVWRVE